MNIFVGNLLFEATEADIKKLFEGFGNVASVAIAMSKDKGKPKPRGFAFVQMPDEQLALAAIASLDGKEFLGRVLRVSPARLNPRERSLPVPIKEGLKKEARRGSKLREEGQEAWFSPVFNKPGTYRGGRRTRSYIKRQGLAGIQEEAKPRKRSQDNPMRWRKRIDKTRPWQKSQGEHKPWHKAEEGARPWKKPAGDAKPPKNKIR